MPKETAIAIVKPAGTLSMLCEVNAHETLFPVSGRTQQGATEASIASEVDISKRASMDAVIKSEATVPVLHRSTGRSNQVQDAQVSRVGVEFEIANVAKVPNLGEKNMAVMTEECTFRGHGSQCTEVSKTLQSMRFMVKSGHAMFFGSGKTATSTSSSTR